MFLCLFFSSNFANIHYPNVSSNKTAQGLFDKAMLNYYGYLYVQAEHDFKQALLYDSQCAMCYWGLAVAKKQQALELNKSFAKVGYQDIQKAISIIPHNDSFYYNLIMITSTSFTLKEKSSKQLQINYINGLRKLHKKYKDNKDWRSESLALLVDAIAYFRTVSEKDAQNVNHCSTIPPTYFKQEALNLLIPVMMDKSYPDHPGILHTYIHLTERNLQDPLGLSAAKKIETFSHNTIAHYSHMKNHIYWRRGMYKEAIETNLKSIQIDENYFKNNGAGLNSYYYEYHYLHSHHFLVFLGVLTNNCKLSIKYARLIKSLMDNDRLENLKDYRDVFNSLEHLALAKFNHWQEILDLDVPPQMDELGNLLVKFTQALAYLNLHQNTEFEKILQQILKTKYSKKNLIDIQILVTSYLQVAEMHSQKVAYKDLKNYLLSQQVDKIEEKMSYTNPPVWFFSYNTFLQSLKMS